MSSLISFYLKKETLSTLLDVVNKKGEKGVELTLSANDESNQYGQNVSGWVSQSKEQREAKKERFFVGNGKVFWTDGTVKLAVKDEPAPQQQAAPVEDESSSDLPF